MSERDVQIEGTCGKYSMFKSHPFPFVGHRDFHLICKIRFPVIFLLLVRLFDLIHKLQHTCWNAALRKTGWRVWASVAGVIETLDQTCWRTPLKLNQVLIAMNRTQSIAANWFPHFFRLIHVNDFKISHPIGGWLALSGACLQRNNILMIYRTLPKHDCGELWQKYHLKEYKPWLVVCSRIDISENNRSEL